MPIYTHDTDVAVIGASTSGLFAASLLAEAGRRVAVFEQHGRIDPARRTLIITPHLRRVLPFPFADATLHTTAIMAVAGPTTEAEIHLDDPDLIVERGALTRLLLQRARDAGVRVHTGLKLVDLEPSSQGVRLHFKERETGDKYVVTARAIIGADGVFSDTARLAGIPRPPFVPILQAEVALPAGWDPQRVQVWFDRGDTRFFYWLIPESEERGVVGLVADPNSDIKGLLLRFLKRHRMTPLAFQGARVAMHHPRLRPWGRVGAAPVYLVGDAAGQVKVTTVGGSVTGFMGAKAAAEAIIHNRPYAATLRPVKRELDVHWWVRWALDRLDNRGYDALIRSLTPRVRAFLGHRTRDEMSGALWWMILTTPSLWRVLPHFIRSLGRQPLTTSAPSSQVYETDLP